MALDAAGWGWRALCHPVRRTRFRCGLCGLVRRGLTATSAATVQLTVPVLAALGGGMFLDEPVTVRQVIAAAAILGGVGLVLLRRPRSG